MAIGCCPLCTHTLFSNARKAKKKKQLKNVNGRADSSRKERRGEEIRRAAVRSPGGGARAALLLLSHGRCDALGMLPCSPSLAKGCREGLGTSLGSALEAQSVGVVLKKASVCACLPLTCAGMNGEF